MPAPISKRFVDLNTLGFEDVTILPAPSLHHEITTETSLATQFSPDIKLKWPLLLHTDQAMLAIACAQNGILNFIPHSLKPSKQAALIHQVKRYQARSIQNPICVTSEMSVAEVMDLQSRYQISAIPVIDSTTRQLIGIISKRNIKEDTDPLDLVTKIMTSENLITLDTHADPAQALDLMKQHRLEQIILVDTDRRCTGLITAKDHTQIQNHPQALMDKHSRLRVGASIGTDSHDLDRVSMLIDEQVDSLFVTGTTLHSKATSDMVTHIRRQRSAQIDVIAGPVMTVAAATALIDAGTNALFMPLKTPDIYLDHGIDLPSFGVLMDLVEACNVSNTALFIDYPIQLDHRTKALAGGASGFIISNTDLDTDTLSEKCILPLKNEIYQALSLTGCTSLGELRTMPRFALKRR